MSTYTEAVRLRQLRYRRSRGVSEQDDFLSIPRLLEAGRELRLLVEEPIQALWTHSDALCVCGQAHRQNIPWTQRNPYGNGFSVAYFCSASCKGYAVAEMMAAA